MTLENLTELQQITAGMHILANALFPETGFSIWLIRPPISSATPSMWWICRTSTLPCQRELFRMMIFPGGKRVRVYQ